MLLRGQLRFNEDCNKNHSTSIRMTYIASQLFDKCYRIIQCHLRDFVFYLSIAFQKWRVCRLSCCASFLYAYLVWNTFYLKTY